MRVARLLSAGLIVAGILQISTAPSGAADLTTAGWWWRAQSGAVGLPPPPHVPPNGLAVGNAPDGPSAVAAVRFSLQPDEVAPALTLAVAEVFAAGSLELVACPATTPWFGTQAGAWEDRPESSCTVGAVNGVESADGASWSFALTGLSRDGLLDVVISAAESSDPFEMSFEAPTAESLRTTTAPSSGDFDPGFDSSDSGSEGSFVPPSGGFGAGEFGRPFSPLDPPSVPGSAAPSDAPSANGRQQFVRIAQPVADTDAGSDPRLLALVILLAALAVAVSMARESLPAPRLLGPMAQRRERDVEDENEVRGVGRFRRPRRGEAPSLH